MSKQDLNGSKRVHALATGLFGSGILFLLLMVLVPMIGVAWAALIGIVIGFPLGYIGANVRGFVESVKIAAKELYPVVCENAKAIYLWCKQPRPLLYAAVVLSITNGFIGGRIAVQFPHMSPEVFFSATIGIVSLLAYGVYLDVIICNLLNPYVHKKYKKTHTSPFWKIDPDKIDFGKRVWMKEFLVALLADSVITKSTYNHVKDESWNNLESSGSASSYLYTVLPMNKTTLRFLARVYIQPWMTFSLFLIKLPFIVLYYAWKALCWIVTVPPVALWKLSLRTFELAHSDIRTACGLDVLAGGFSAYALYHQLLSTGVIAQNQITLVLGTLCAMGIGLLFAHASYEIVKIGKDLSSIELDLT